MIQFACPLHRSQWEDLGYLPRNFFSDVTGFSAWRGHKWDFFFKSRVFPMWMDFNNCQRIITTSREMLLATYLKHNFVENSPFLYVAYDLRNNLEHANFTQNIYFATSQLLVYESWWNLPSEWLIRSCLFTLEFMVVSIYLVEISQKNTFA